MAYLDQLRAQLANDKSRGRAGIFDTRTAQPAIGVSVYGGTRAPAMLRILDDPETRRLRFDMRQAAVFGDLDEGPPLDIQQMLHPPFEQFYLELTQPLSGAIEPEPGIEGEDLLRSIMWLGSDEAEIGGHPSAVHMRDEHGGVMGPMNLTPVMFAFHGTGGAYVDRGFYYDARTGVGYTQFEATQRISEKGGDGWEVAGGDASTFTEGDADVVGNTTLVACGQHDGHYGTWERMVMDMADLLGWLLAYMNARSVIIEEQRVSRQMRRAAERAGRPTPIPWHVIKVKPVRVPGDDDGEPGRREVAYRFDVMGHFRKGRHKRGDGTYAERIEWVRPHQRGLKHTRYIPAVRQFDRGSRRDDGMLRGAS